MLGDPLPAPLVLTTAAGNRSLCLISQSDGGIVVLAYAFGTNNDIDQITLTLRPDQVRQLTEHLAPLEATTPAPDAIVAALTIAPRIPANGTRPIGRVVPPAPRVADRRVFAMHEQIEDGTTTAVVHTATCDIGLIEHTASASWLANYINRTPGTVTFCPECEPLGADTATANEHISGSVPAARASAIALNLALAVLHRQAEVLPERVDAR